MPGQSGFHNGAANPAFETALQQFVPPLEESGDKELSDEPAKQVRTGVVYTETVVHLASERFAADVPYQVIIVSLDEGSNMTARVVGERVAIDDRVVETEMRDGISFFRKSST